MAKTPLEIAYEAAGGQSELARKLNISRQVVHNWKRTKQIPALRVLSIEKATGVPRHVLRPDLYPRG